MFTDINDSRDDSRTREQEDEVRDILRRRRKSAGHVTYGLIAFTLGSLALLVWGSIYSDAQHEEHAPLTMGYAAFLSFAIVLGFAAVAVGCTWANIRENRKQAADEDRIREYRQQQQLEAIRDAIIVFLRDGDRDTQGALTAVQKLINSRSGPGDDNVSWLSRARP